MGTNTSGHILVADGTNYNPVAVSGDISLSNTGAAAIASGVIVNADINASAAIADSKLDTITTANKVGLASLDIDGATDIGEAIVDADLFVIDNGAGGTNRKVAASRIKSYAGGSSAVTALNNATANELVTVGSTTTELDAEANLLFDGNILYVGDSANGNMTSGITINQAGNDDDILTFKSSDVAHGKTSHGETDTFARFFKANDATGGLFMRVFRDNSGGNEGTFVAQSFGPSTFTTTKTGGNWNAAHEFNVFGHDGSNGFADATANGNVFSISVSKGGGTSYIFGIDEDGDIYQDGTTNNAFDAWDDAALLRSLQLQQTEDHQGRNTLSLDKQIIESRFDGNRYTKEHLQQAKLIEVVADDEWNKGELHRSLINETVRGYVQTGAIWQNHEMIDALMEALEAAMTDAGVNNFQQDYVKPKFVERGLPTQILDWSGSVPSDITVPDIAPKAFNA